MALLPDGQIFSGNGTYSITESINVAGVTYSASKSFPIKIGSNDTAAIKVDFGYSVTYNSDSSSVSIEASDASSHIPTNAVMYWYCNGNKFSSLSSTTANWSNQTANWWGFVSITENVVINNEIYSAVHSFIVIRK